MKRNETKRNQQKRNEMKRNQRNENKIKRNQRKQNEINMLVMKWSHDYKRDVSHPNESQI
jgi:hypothetical protein